MGILALDTEDLILQTGLQNGLGGGFDIQRLARAKPLNFDKDCTGDDAQGSGLSRLMPPPPRRDWCRSGGKQLECPRFEKLFILPLAIPAKPSAKKRIP